MGDDLSPGRRFRQTMEEEVPLQVVGTVNACCAKLAERAGFRALYLSGAGVANASFGLPDLGMTTFQQVLEDARRITAATSLPLLVDCDTGWGSSATRDPPSFNIGPSNFRSPQASRNCTKCPGGSIK